MAQGKVSDADLAIGPPFPTAKKDDVEDVSWALSTAEANWNRGDHADAIKWIRRAAEAAAEAELDDRALELAKAAADLASLIVHTAEAKPEAVPNTLQSHATGASQAPNAPIAPRTGPAPAPVPAGRRTGPAPKAAPAPPQPIIANPRAASAKAPAGADAPPLSARAASAKAPASARAQAPQAALPKAVSASRAGERRAGRRSAHNLAEEAARAAKETSANAAAPPSPAAATAPVTASAPTPNVAAPAPAPAPAAAAPPVNETTANDIPKDDEEDVELTRSLPGKQIGATNEARRRGRGSKPSIDAAAAPPPAPPEELMRTGKMEVPQIYRTEHHHHDASHAAHLPATTEEIDQWPTQSLSSEELTTLTEERREQARGLTSEIPHTAASPEVRATQAMRVIMWRAVDGVHVAPVGTPVNALTTEVMLVAMDPTVDVAAWLRTKK